MNVKKAYPLYFLVLPAAVYGLLYFVPSLFSFYYAMTDWNAFSDGIRFVGFKNYQQIFAGVNRGYLVSLWNTVNFAAVTTVAKNALGLMLALALNGPIRTKNLLRTVFYLPVTLSALVVGLIFSAVYHPDYGLINALLRSAGFEGFDLAWLVDRSTAMGSVMAVEIWKSTGFNMIIYLAGLQTIPQIYYEAARIDGASRRGMFLRITLPLIMPAVSVNLILNLINGFKVFDLVFILTKGGPGNLTQVLNTAVFQEFSAGRYGLATAFGVVLLIITATVALMALKLLSRGSEVTE